jgi:hypothetical protein
MDHSLTDNYDAKNLPRALSPNSRTAIDKVSHSNLPILHPPLYSFISCRYLYSNVNCVVVFCSQASRSK